ncbi:MAG: helix-turn-helix domain-containing protein, partial [bacterium]|nr:helix-turn-helix domain-containing protein [bacterium]
MHGNLPESLMDRAKAAVLAWIREDRIGVLDQVDRILVVLLECLCDQNLDARQAMIKAGIKSHSVRGMFKAATGWSLGDYIKHRRIQVATWLLHNSTFSCTSIGYALGWIHYSTFNDACQTIHERLYGKRVRPGDVRKAGAELYPPPEMPAPEGGPGDVALVDAGAAGDLEAGLEPGSPPQFMYAGRLHEKVYALGFWTIFRELPYAKQRWWVRHARSFFVTPAFFDLLRI